jgi:hypothetical protein
VGWLYRKGTQALWTMEALMTKNRTFENIIARNVRANRGKLDPHMVKAMAQRKASRKERKA